MDKKTIGIILNCDSNWYGGVYYIASMVEFLSKENNNQIYLFIDNQKKYHISFSNTDNLVVYHVKFKSRLRIFYEVLTKKNFIPFYKPENIYFQYLFPIGIPPIRSHNEFYYLSWIPDVQHKVYPEYFSKINWILRELNFKYIAKFSDKILFSSTSQKELFRNFYSPKSKLFTYNFSSNINSVKEPDLTDIFKLYNINEHPYVMVSNQLYKHKNYELVIEIAKLLKNRDINMICTGKIDDYRDVNYGQALLTKKVEEKIDNLYFLGVIPRNQQIILLMNSLLAFQPSKYEGWNTFIEDSKILGKHILASDIPVHREQLPKNKYFFPVNDPKIAYHMILNIIDGNHNPIKYVNEEGIKKRRKQLKFFFS